MDIFSVEDGDCQELNYYHDANEPIADQSAVDDLVSDDGFGPGNISQASSIHPVDIEFLSEEDHSWLLADYSKHDDSSMTTAIIEDASVDTARLHLLWNRICEDALFRVPIMGVLLPFERGIAADIFGYKQSPDSLLRRFGHFPLSIINHLRLAHRLLERPQRLLGR